MKNYWDYYSTMKTAVDKGRAEGRAEGHVQANADNARRMKADGMQIELITIYTGLTKEEIAGM